MRRRSMNRALAAVLLLGLLGLAAPGCGEKGGSAETEGEPVARVRVEVVRADTLAETLGAYGTVIPAPGSVQSFAVPFECVVSRVLVGAGQRVAPTTPLVRIAVSPGVALEAAKAEAALTSQETVTADTRQRFDMGLATRDELALQEQSLANARAEAHKYELWSKQSLLISPASGLVREVLVSEGALVPAGGALVSLDLQHRFEVRLGAEPEDIDLLHVGQPVRLQPMDREGRMPVVGRIRSVGQQVSPDTRLVDVLVALPDVSTHLLLNQVVHAEIEVQNAEGLIVPRSALLPREDHFMLFTIHLGRAASHRVELGVETDSLVQVSGSGVAAGDSVVILGNYVLRDSMRVQPVAGVAEGRP